MKICIILWTRPEILKLYGIMKECQSRWLDYYVIHTGQHYSDNMSKDFFEELWLPRENYNLMAKCSDRIERMWEIQRWLQTIWKQDQPNIVIVQWDTDSAFVGWLTAKMMWIKVAHIEAWIRSNSDIPEEYNRRMIDQFSDYLFVPTEKDMKNILYTSLSELYIVWNTICDTIRDFKPKGVMLWGYVFMTLHRNTNVDSEINLRNIIQQVKWLWKKIIFSCHPRTMKMIESFEIDMWEIVIVPPMTYQETIWHIYNADYIITDSWGIQEECCILRKKCIIMRDSTERPYKGSILWKWDLKEAEDNIKNVNIWKQNPFNPNNSMNISSEILNLIV